MLMRRDESVLLIIDIQERLVPAVENGNGVIAQTKKLIHAAQHLHIPVLASEQYRKGLGDMVSELRTLLPSGACFDKTTFSCFAQAGVPERFAALQRRQIVITGMEAHVCVLQSAIDFLQANYQVFVTADAVSSRVRSSYDFGLARLRNAKVQIVTAEMVLFEWLGAAGTTEFKELLPLIK